MWRLLFLILVVLGALAVLLAVILGVGVAKVAMVQGDDAPATTAPASQPVSPATRTIVSQAAPIAVNSVVPNPVPPPVIAPPVIAPPVARGPVEAPAVIPPGGFVPGTLVLRGADAKLHGKVLRKTPPEGDLTSWTRSDDFATWVFYPVRGKYRVVITRSNGANSGGDFALVMGDSKKTDPLFLAKATPTGGWDTFRTEFVGILDLEEKRTTLAIRPAGDLTSTLMRLRKIELIPIDLPDVKKPDPNDDGPPDITGLTIVDAMTGKPLGMLTNAMVLDLSTLPPISLRAETSGKVGSVRFNVNKSDLPVESERPFSIAGERGTGYIPWKPEPGKYTILLSPFSEPGAGGKAGKRQILYVTIVSSAPIVLLARDAILHGDTIRLQRGDEPTITTWTAPQDWIEWSVSVPNPGNYDVELHYSVAKNNGGDFVLRVGDAKFTDDVKSTGGWEIYDRMHVGIAKLSRGKTRVAIKPSELGDGKMLMNLREVRLSPVVDDD